ncbi:MAG TPA: PaaI family thioesterase [Chloroflexia bacterium]|nr:PaaI family thioesterase [Chloroflexia bacterium]
MDNAEFLALGRQVLATQPFSVLLGARLEAFQPGRVTLALTLKPEHMQQHGMAHGGVVSYLADNALTFAGGSALGVEVITAEFKINYARPARGSALIARASVVATSGRQAVCRCDVWAVQEGGEVLVAAAQGTIVRRAADSA